MNRNICEYSKIGEYHRKNHLENQDYLYVQETDKGIFCAVADGVSACENSRQGAEIACKVSAKVILDDIDYYFEASREKTINLVLSNVRNHIRRAAEAADQSGDSFASTLCFICIHKQKKQRMTFVLGDSKAYSLQPNRISQLNPVREYADNVTCTTMTRSAGKDAGLSVEPFGDSEGLLLCTDGCWKALFDGDVNRVKPLQINNIDNVKTYLDSVGNGDDCSFLAVV